MTAPLIELANTGDDPELRRILRENAMDGDISVAFEREPSFLAAARLEGRDPQVLVARAGDPPRVVAVASRATRPLWVNGEPREMGYLSSLRIAAGRRGGTLLARGYGYIRELHERDGRVPAYVSTIIADNRVAVDVLTSGRAGLPTYRPLGILTTHAVQLFRPRPPLGRPGIELRRASRDMIPELVALLAASGRRHQLAPVLDEDDLSGARDSLPGLTPEDFHVALAGGRLVGCVAGWDLSHLKQTVVAGYAGRMRLVKPAWDLTARLLGFRPLPAVGEHFRYLYASHLAVADDDPAVAALLVRSVYNANAGGRYAYFMLGLHADDPLARALAGYRTIRYDARLYLVHWEDGAAFATALDPGRIPRPEIALL